MKKILLTIASLIVLGACDGNGVNNTFSNLPARLTIDNVLQAPVLFTACESMDQYCTVTSDGQRFLFKDFRGKTSPINIAAINSYYLGVNGFFIGKPSIVEMGKEVHAVVCFDRVCPNCYEDSNRAITKDLVFASETLVTCKGCKRTYNLNNRGIVESGPSGIPLYRYRVNYTGNALIIRNG